MKLRIRDRLGKFVSTDGESPSKLNILLDWFASKFIEREKRELFVRTLIISMFFVGIFSTISYTRIGFNQFSSYIHGKKVLAATVTAVTKQDEATSTDLYTMLDALMEKRTQMMMKDPSNLKEYHDLIYKKVSKGVNILTTKF